MNKNITAFLLTAAVVVDVYLEIKKVPVPSVVLLLSGFCVRHIIGDNTVITGNGLPGGTTQTIPTVAKKEVTQ